MATTLLLDRDGWDLALDALGNWALASEPYSQTQDVASAVRVVQGEAYYNTTLGVPYFSDVLGREFPSQLFRAKARQAALTVPGVTDAAAFLNLSPDRVLSGQIQIRSDSGVQVVSL